MKIPWGSKSRMQYQSPPPTLLVSYEGRAVAELKKKDGKYHFSYLKAFEEMNLSPLPGLKNPNSIHDELPMFFKERLPDFRRPEVLKWLSINTNVNPNDDLQLLGALGAHSITDSFVLTSPRAA